MFSNIENQFNVIYPDNPNATYQSILNYSLEKNDPIQRWYRYKEGFSIQFVNKVISEFRDDNTSVILDPFAGSGTTIVAANRLGMRGIGFEVNPFSHFLLSTKQAQYSVEELTRFDELCKGIIFELKQKKYEKYVLPPLSFADEIFQDDAEVAFMSCKTKIDRITDTKIKNLLLLGWLSCLEELSNYRKAGNGLKKRKTVKPFIVSAENVIVRLDSQYKMMLEDLLSGRAGTSVENIVYNDTCLNFSDVLGRDTVDGIIFSPPYANCFDYTEIYKLELWFANFVSNREDLKRLRTKSLKSHLNVKYDFSNLTDSSIELLNEQIAKIAASELWDHRIPQMLYGYFTDMFNVIDNCYASLRKGGFCAIVVGNSAYSGIVVPTDLILSLYAKQIGFTVNKIEVDRFIITSSQQYEKTKENGKYLRESVICLTK